MKSTNVIITLGLASFLCFSACKPKDPIIPINEGVNNFMPTSTQNSWNYEASDGTHFQRKYTGRDSVVNGFSYNLFQQTTTGGVVKNEFYAKFEGKYYSLIPIDDANTTYVKAIVLGSDNPKVGDTWTNEGSFNYSGIDFTAKVDGEVMSISDTTTVNGVLLDSIVTVKSRLFAKLPLSTYTDAGTVIMKMKKGVGIISEDYDFHVSTFVNKTYSNWLLSYSIQP